jgi:hypothetical protein
VSGLSVLDEFATNSEEGSVTRLYGEVCKIEVPIRD